MYGNLMILISSQYDRLIITHLPYIYNTSDNLSRHIIRT
jgi:hypothetical protein